MCGIAGYIHFDRSRSASITRLKKMTEVIKHRGPDGGGFTIPVGKWFTNGAGAILEDRVVKSIEAGFVEGKTVKAILEQHQNGLRDAGNALWTLGMLSFANGEK